MTTELQRYSRSSSLALGAVLAGLMLLGVALAGFFIVFASEETFVQETDTAISAEMRAARTQSDKGQDAFDDWLQQSLANNSLGFLYGLKDPAETTFIGNVGVWPETNVDVIKEGLISFQYAAPNAEHRSAVARIMTLADGRHFWWGAMSPR